VRKRFSGGLGCLIALQLGGMHAAIAQDQPAGAPAQPAATAPASGDSGDLDSLLNSAPSTPSSSGPAAPAQPAAAAPNAATSQPAQAGNVQAPPSGDASATQGSEPAEKAASSGPKNRLTEEIVVTAEKREQNLQEVPSSIQAFTGGTLDAKGVSDVKDLQLVTPGLQYDSMASYSIIYIRGIGGDAFQAGVDSSVATYIDGLYLPFTFSSAQALGDVSQIEVLKGPQGTLYGRNAIAGAINIKLKEPTKDFSASVLQQFGDYNEIKTKLSASGPVPLTNQTLTYAGSFLYEDHDAYDIYYLDPSEKYHPYRNIGFRGALKYSPLDNLDFQASYYYVKNQDADSVVTVLLNPAPAFSTILTGHDVSHESGNQTNVGVFGKTRIENFTAHWTPDLFDAKFILGHTDAYSNIIFDYDSAPEPVLDISALPNTDKSTSGELVLTSNPANTPDWLEWIGGLYEENTVKTGQYVVTVDALALALGTPLSSQFGGASPLCTIYTQLGGDCTTNTDTNKNPLLRVPLTSGVQNRDKSMYGQITFHLSDQVSAVAGARYSTEQVRLLYSDVNAYLTDIPVLGTTPTFTAIAYQPQEHTYNSFTPNFGLNYKMLDNVMLYYKYSEAFKSGNYNGLNINKPPSRVNPEEAAGNEVGFKTELLPDRTLKLNGALFTTTVTNAQVQTLSLVSGGVTSLQNAAAYTVRGGELEANWFATDALVFSLTGDILHGRYDSYVGEGYPPPLYLNNNSVNYTGNRTVRTPTYTATAAVNYTFPFFFGLTAEASGDVYYTSGYWFDALNDVGQPAYFIVNSRFGLFDPRTNIRVTAYGKNINNASYFSQKYAQDFGDTGFYAAPRTFGVMATWSFGS
jgi:iron complex outermembrane recepter protein